MKVALVFPPYTAEDNLGESNSLNRVLNIVPPLGLAYLAAFLEEHDYEVQIFDGGLDYDYPSLMEALRLLQPDIVGISSPTPVYESAKRVARGVREHLPGAVTVIGGPHVTAIPEQGMTDPCFDVGVVGEGEETLLDLVRHVEAQGLKGFESIPGIAFRDLDTGQVRLSPPRTYISDLDSIPFPARHLLPPLQRYQPTPASYTRLPLGSMITTRGCPAGCTFCDRSIFGRKYRFRTPENVVDEIEEMMNRHGAREIRFFDDAFTINKKRTIEICREIKRRGLDIRWTCLTRTTAVSKELLEVMKDAGCWQVLFGLESGDETMLKKLKKGATVERNAQAVGWAQEVGVGVRGDFIVGTPGETPETFRATVDWAIKMNIDYVQFNKFVPLPGTELYHMLVDEGYSFDFTQLKTGISDNAFPMYISENLRMTPAEYKRALDKAYRRFYLRPSYIARRTLKLRSFDQLRGHLDGMFGIMGMR